ncbi:MAG: hypothetical protein WAV46_00170 [Candidatus Moraniibacteriota bacterium]
MDAFALVRTVSHGTLQTLYLSQYFGSTYASGLFGLVSPVLAELAVEVLLQQSLKLLWTGVTVIG